MARDVRRGIFAAFCAGAFAFAYRYVPETKGRSIEEIRLEPVTTGVSE
ncbi:MAG TPA: hypothetical protein VGQ84_13740 [Gaiellaceae bacterium]|nr:hypothetical protein [Gaiellaceae bacterium]